MVNVKWRIMGKVGAKVGEKWAIWGIYLQSLGANDAENYRQCFSRAICNLFVTLWFYLCAIIFFQ